MVRNYNHHLPHSHQKTVKYRASCSQISKVSSLVSLVVHFRTSLTSYPTHGKLITLASLTQA